MDELPDRDTMARIIANELHAFGLTSPAIEQDRSKPGRYVTTRAAADQLGVSPDTIRRWVRQGHIRNHVLIGPGPKPRQWVLWSDVKAMMREPR